MVVLSFAARIKNKSHQHTSGALGQTKRNISVLDMWIACEYVAAPWSLAVVGGRSAGRPCSTAAWQKEWTEMWEGGCGLWGSMCPLTVDQKIGKNSKNRMIFCWDRCECVPHSLRLLELEHGCVWMWKHQSEHNNIIYRDDCGNDKRDDRALILPFFAFHLFGFGVPGPGDTNETFFPSSITWLTGTVDTGDGRCSACVWIRKCGTDRWIYQKSNGSDLNWTKNPNFGVY